MRPASIVHNCPGRCGPAAKDAASAQRLEVHLSVAAGHKAGWRSVSECAVSKPANLIQRTLAADSGRGRHG